MKELQRFRQFLNEGSFGDKVKAALENKLTGIAKDLVEDGSLFAEYGNVTYDEADLKDGARPEEIEAIDQIKTAVIEMGGRVNYGVSDEDGTLTYMYLVVDEPPTYDAVLKVITKENNEPNLFRSVFKEEEEAVEEMYMGPNPEAAPIRKQIYKGMDMIDSAIAQGRGIIPQDKWDGS